MSEEDPESIGGHRTWSSVSSKGCPALISVGGFELTEITRVSGWGGDWELLQCCVITMGAGLKIGGLQDGFRVSAGVQD